MFPGPGAEIHRNEAGEPLSWDYPSFDNPYEGDDQDPFDYGEDDDRTLSGRIQEELDEEEDNDGE
jgi:hypothetical protein